ncbi:MAG TPA: ATP-dependent helicase HrpB [Flavobacteriales bacterium]|nr:ATP-dependent helicase HrpB [Flavobacteriales bacterium]HRE97613.1 ATP-dependent helicase HrpB [Flavobacteriales bacterium]HRJ37158.1 ATP-dependent helicase HrpB [Flavobacteriales bacterium]
MDKSLPILEILPELKKKLSDNILLLLQAPPGAGKSTWLPLELLQEPWLNNKKILLLEPRRLAARTVAQRLAHNLGEDTGEIIGYRIRFETKISHKTRIEVVTEGILTRMLQNDNALEEYGLLLFDEFHERNLNADLALALSREIQQVLRPDLRILIMSATLGCESLASELGNVPVVISEGRQFPIEYRYHEPNTQLQLAENCVALIQKASAETEGDILAFLPGSGDILRAAELLEKNNSSLSVATLYGDMPFSEQQHALLPDSNGKRKVILSTSIAETSLTIEGIRVVIDSGFTRSPRFDTRSGFTKLETVKISQDTATQRAGRAGRTSSGICYRMWAKHTHQQLTEHRKPEILDADLAQLTLELAGWGQENIESLKWVTAPPIANVAQAKTILKNLNAIDDKGKITPEGKKILEIPSHPRIAHLLLTGKKQSCPALACDVAALLEERDPLRRSESADLLLRIEALHKWRKKERTDADRHSLERIERVSLQWRKLLKTETIDEHINPFAVGSLIAAAFPERIARKTEQEGRYRLGNGRMARLPKNDSLSDADWIAVATLDAGSGEGKIFLAAPFDHNDLLKIATEHETIRWDNREELFIARKEWKVGDLIVKEVPLNTITSDQRSNAICEALKRSGKEMLDWSDELLQLQNRVLSLRKWNPEMMLPDLDTDVLIQNASHWLAPYLSEARTGNDLKKINLHNAIMHSIDWNVQQEIDSLAPKKIKVPSGSEIALEYFEDGRSPILAVRLQECFGLTETPTVNQGKTKVLMHLLSPGYKPVQITQDLPSFWNNLYHEVRKELKIRYPRHSWPEDPWKAEAVRGAVKRRSEK